MTPPRPNIVSWCKLLAFVSSDDRLLASSLNSFLFSALLALLDSLALYFIPSFRQTIAYIVFLFESITRAILRSTQDCSLSCHDPHGKGAPASPLLVCVTSRARIGPNKIPNPQTSIRLATTPAGLYTDSILFHEWPQSLLNLPLMSLLPCQSPRPNSKVSRKFCPTTNALQTSLAMKP